MVKKRKKKINKKTTKKAKVKEKALTQKSAKQNLYRPNVFKSADEKTKIKKVLKQATEKRIYNIKDYVVYPKHGVGKIVSVEKAKIG